MDIEKAHKKQIGTFKQLGIVVDFLLDVTFDNATWIKIRRKELKKNLFKLKERLP